MNHRRTFEIKNEEMRDAMHTIAQRLSRYYFVIKKYANLKVMTPPETEMKTWEEHKKQMAADERREWILALAVTAVIFPLIAVLFIF